MLILAAYDRGLPMDYDELERPTRIRLRARAVVTARWR
jgi:hypothetical protein